MSKVVEAATNTAVQDFAKLTDRIKVTTTAMDHLDKQALVPATHQLGQFSSGLKVAATNLGNLGDSVPPVVQVATALENCNAHAHELAASGAAAVTATAARYKALAESVHSVSSEMQALGVKSMAMGAGLGATLYQPVQAFMSLEDAMTRARVAYLTVAGDDPFFGKISKMAVDLGNKLPGTTADFMQMAAALKEAGIQSKTIAQGGLEATAYLRVLMGNLAPEQAAHLVATFKQSLGIAEKDFVKFVDLVQRAKFAFGLNPEEFSYSVKYFGAIAKQMGVQGLEASKPLIAMTGMLRQAGIDGSTAGTSLRSVMETLPRLDHHIHKSKELRAILGSYKMHLDFFNKKGQFLGMENLVVQLDKLQKMNVKDRLAAIELMFGKETSSTVAELVGQGVNGYNKALDTLQRQASLQKRLELVMGTLRNLWEAATGTLENTFAAIGETVGPDLKRLANLFNDVSAKIGDWIHAHPALTRQIFLGTAALSAFLIVAGGTLVVLGTLGHGLAFGITGWAKLSVAVRSAGAFIAVQNGNMVRMIGLQRLMDAIAYRGGFWNAMQYQLMVTKFRLLEAVSSLRAWTVAQAVAFRANFLTISGLRGLAVGFGSGLLNAIRVATVASWGFVASLLANPITWIVIAIVAAAALIYKFWAPISGFFRGLWQGIKEGFAPMAATLGPKMAALAVFMQPVMTALAGVWRWLKALVAPVNDTGHAAEKLGVTWGRVIGQMLAAVVALPAKLFSAGQGMITQLVAGIQSMAPKATAAMTSVAQQMRNLLPFSPAKAGPLRDLHRVKLVETIAAGVRPAPLVAAMSRVAGAVAPALRGGIGRTALAGAAAGGGGMTLHYNPTVTIGSGSAQDREDFLGLLRDHKDELAELVNDHRESRARSSY